MTTKTDRVYLKLADIKVGFCYECRYGKIRKITGIVACRATRAAMLDWRGLTSPTRTYDEVHWAAVRGFGNARGSNYAGDLVGTAPYKNHPPLLVKAVPEPAAEVKVYAHALVSPSRGVLRVAFLTESWPANPTNTADRWMLLAGATADTLEDAESKVRAKLSPAWAQHVSSPC